MKKIIINKQASINSALRQLKYTGTKCLVVLDNNHKVLGTLSDGDLRKRIIRTGNTKGSITNIFNKKPYIIKNSHIKKYNKKIARIFVKKQVYLNSSN